MEEIGQPEVRASELSIITHTSPNIVYLKEKGSIRKKDMKEME